MSSSTKQPDSSGCADNLRPAVTTEDALSDDQKSLLAGVAAGQTLRTAAERAGVYILDAHGWLKDEMFAKAYAAAEAAGTDVIEEEAFRRAVKGVEKPVYRAGEVVGHVADYSDAMLMFLLKARRPDRYGPGKADKKGEDTASLAEQLNLKATRDAVLGKFLKIADRTKT